MLQTMLIMASIMSVIERKRSLNMRYLTNSMIMPAIGAKTAMSLNISAPNVSRGNRIAGYVILLVSLFFLDDLAYPVRNLLAVRPFFKGHVDCCRLSVF